MSKWEHCNNCGGKRKCVVLFEASRPWSERLSPDFEINGSDNYEVIECSGCEAVSFIHFSWFSEIADDDGAPIKTRNHFPPETFRPEPKWLRRLDEDWHIAKLLKEVYVALQSNALAIAAMGIRAIIESMMIEKVGDQGTFAQNLDACKRTGLISLNQEQVLGAALELGHASIHRGFMPDLQQLEASMDIVESLIQGWHFLPKDAAAVIKGVPKRASKKKA